MIKDLHKNDVKAIWQSFGGSRGDLVISPEDNCGLGGHLYPAEVPEKKYSGVGGRF
jgi:hypothetical protein